ncbi:DUF6151 family protein [Enterovibrio sp. ZSDZ35]|uniref:DUF6151 family protein n=1 Tax=Enterovibrio qingdaonensis TaxID=2899818 RepID=A0ABT5QI14_9GAMM|nr:DUF6151 family protein [Enterovibrio sp. ZSDZ35]MDD1780120.1 DUF6151 family protein [Enterovibrio sp. ZSDZ35]
MTDLAFQCECGELTGTVINASPKLGNHMICYCDDCQRFARYLGHEEKWLDEWGGTDIYQVPPANIRIDKGAENLRCVRVKPKGIYRFYASCCRTPIANSPSYKMPLAGIPTPILQRKNKKELIGPVTHTVMGSFAKGSPPSKPHPKFSFGSVVKVLTFLLRNTLKGTNTPTPFFTPDGKAVSPPEKIADKR